jgi:RimJ/RimL family protein N-acetyltransferase
LLYFQRTAVELTTERLILRDFTADDRAALIAYQSDPRYVEFYGPEERGHEHTLKLLDMFLHWRVEQPRRNFQLAIVERNAPPDPIGCCGVRSKGFESGVAEFGLELAPRCWGRGLATEAARALLTFAFRDLGLRVITRVSVTQNYRVAHLVNRLGFHSVSTRVGPDWMRAQGWSQTEWRLTAQDWEDTVGRITSRCN